MTLSHDHDPMRLDAAALDRYLAGETTPEEREVLERVLEAHPPLADITAGMRSVTYSTHHEENAIDVEAAWQRFMAPVARIQHRPQHQERQWVQRTTVWSTSLGLAGIVAIVAIVAGRWRAESPTGSTRTYTTSAAKQATIPLADGSRIVLGPSTAVRMSDSAGRINVDLVGEALFTVVHGTRPFSVRTTHAVTRVLGTTFSVRHYANDTVSRITVIEGRVSIAAQSAPPSQGPTMLSAHMQCFVDQTGHAFTVSHVDVEDDTAWTTGRLVFRDVRVRDVAVELSRAYDVTIRVPDPALANYVVTWTVPTKRASLKDALDELGDMLDAHITRSAQGITLIGGRSRLRRTFPSKQTFTPESGYGR